MLNDKTKFNSAEVEQHLAAFGRATQRPAPNLRPGEIAAGLILDVDTGDIHHLVLMPGELINVTWDQAKAIFTATGGDLPDTCEMTLLNSNLLDEFDIEEQYWSNEVGRMQGDVADTVMYHSFGPDGCFEFTGKDDTMRARGVRRVPIESATAPAMTPPTLPATESQRLVDCEAMIQALQAGLMKCAAAAGPETLSLVSARFNEIVMAEVQRQRKAEITPHWEERNYV